MTPADILIEKILILHSARGEYYLHTQNCESYGNKKCHGRKNPRPSRSLTYEFTMIIVALSALIFLVVVVLCCRKTNGSDRVAFELIRSIG